jgi:predicted naringenin-chalcone synthase
MESNRKGFRITLSPEVPVLIRENLGHDVDEFLADHGHKRGDIGSWVLHTGGPKVLEATADALDLHDGQLDPSWDCLKKGGNLIVRVGAGRAGRCDAKPASRAGHAGRARGHGAGILF